MTFDEFHMDFGCGALALSDTLIAPGGSLRPPRRSHHSTNDVKGDDMPHAKPEDLPADGGGRWPAANGGFRSVQWGDMEVGFTETEPIDCTKLYQGGGLPGGVCPCPHYGFVFEGSIKAVYPNTDWPEEIATAGEVCFFPAGHVLIYPEPEKALELNPAFALQQCMDAMQRAADKFDGSTLLDRSISRDAAT